MQQVNTATGAPAMAGVEASASSQRLLGGVWGWGTGGCLAALYYVGMLIKAGLRSPDPSAPDFRTVAGFDLAANTRSARRRFLGVDATLNPNDVFIPDSLDVPLLQGTFAKHASMQRWAKAITSVPGRIEQGAGQEPAVGAAFLAHNYEEFAKFAAAKLAMQRNPDLLHDATQAGQQPAHGQKARQVNLATGFGGTGAGTVGIGALTQRLQANQETEIILVASTQPSEQDADSNKKLNLVTFLRQLTRAARAPVRVPGWERELVNEGRPLIDTIVLVSPETKHLTLGREAVQCAMARAAFELLDGDSTVDQYFRDFETEAAIKGSSGTHGSPRIYQVFGSADLYIDVGRSRQMLIDTSRKRLCDRLLNGPAYHQPSATKGGLL